MGFEESLNRDSDQSFKRRNTDGTTSITVVPRARKELPRGTLTSILKLGNISRDEFLQNLR